MVISAGVQVFGGFKGNEICCSQRTGQISIRRIDVSHSCYVWAIAPSFQVMLESERSPPPIDILPIEDNHHALASRPELTHSAYCRLDTVFHAQVIGICDSTF